MKFNPITLLVGSVAAIALTLTPAIVKAQTTDAEIHLPPALEQLNLTSDQRAQLTQIRQETRTQLEGILTAEQQAEFRTAMQGEGGFRQAIAAMNLSDDQKTQLRSIFQSARQEGSAVLTDEQRQQVQQFVRSHMANRRHPGTQE